MLQHALSLGYKITKINRAIKSEQKDSLKPYIEKHTERRKIASVNGDIVRLRYHKLMINALFGKQMENVFNYRDFRVIKDSIKARQLNSKVNFHDTKKISKNGMLYEMIITNVLIK